MPYRLATSQYLTMLLYQKNAVVSSPFSHFNAIFTPFWKRFILEKENFGVFVVLLLNKVEKSRVLLLILHIDKIYNGEYNIKG